MSGTLRSKYLRVRKELLAKAENQKVRERMRALLAGRHGFDWWYYQFTHAVSGESKKICLLKMDAMKRTREDDYFFKELIHKYGAILDYKPLTVGPPLGAVFFF